MKMIKKLFNEVGNCRQLPRKHSLPSGLLEDYNGNVKSVLGRMDGSTVFA